MNLNLQQSGLARLASTIFGNASTSTNSNAAASTSKNILDVSTSPDASALDASLTPGADDDHLESDAEAAALAGLPMGFGSSKRSFLGSSEHLEFPTPEDEGDAPSDAKKPPRKKRRTNLGKATEGEDAVVEYPEGWIAKYDASSLGVVHYSEAAQVPDELRKYFSQRYRLLSLYSSPPGCLLDREGWYSVTPEAIADQIAERCRCDTILDAFCGVGGNSIAFAKTCERVIALDTSPTRLALARHNAQIYGVADRIEFVLGDYISFAKSYIHRRQSHAKNASESRQERGTIDVVFLSPPWGGMGYIAGSPSKELAADPLLTPTMTSAQEAAAAGEYSLLSIQPIHGKELFDLTREITPNVAYFLPRNTSMEEVGALVGSDSDDGSSQGKRKKGKGKKNKAVEMIEVEEEWMGNKLKALTCYFGGLVQEQEESF